MCTVHCSLWGQHDTDKWNWKLNNIDALRFQCAYQEWFDWMRIQTCWKSRNRSSSMATLKIIEKKWRRKIMPSNYFSALFVAWLGKSYSFIIIIIFLLFFVSRHFASLPRWKVIFHPPVRRTAIRFMGLRYLLNQKMGNSQTRFSTNPIYLKENKFYQFVQTCSRAIYSTINNTVSGGWAAASNSHIAD